MTYRWELGHDGCSATLKGVATKFDPLGQFSLAYAEKLPWGGCQYILNYLEADQIWRPAADLEEAKALVITTLILLGVIEP